MGDFITELSNSDQIIQELELAKKSGDDVVLLKDLAKDKPKRKTFSTGFTMFDEAMEGGFSGGDLVVISGISGHGKTSFAQTLTYNLCRNKFQTLWFSYEVSTDNLDAKFRKMGIGEFYHVFTPRKNTTGKLDWVKKKILHSIIENHTKIVFIDHIDFLKSTKTKNSDNEAIALKNIAIELKDIAVKYNIVIVLMAHLKKLPDDFKEPTMQDIGYSAGIFQLADYIFIIWRLQQKNPDSDSGEVFGPYSKIKIVKNRLTGRTTYQKVIMHDELFTLEDNIHEEEVDNLPF